MFQKFKQELIEAIQAIAMIAGLIAFFYVQNAVTEREIYWMGVIIRWFLHYGET